MICCEGTAEGALTKARVCRPALRVVLTVPPSMDPV